MFDETDLSISFNTVINNEQTYHQRYYTKQIYSFEALTIHRQRKICKTFICILSPKAMKQFQIQSKSSDIAIIPR